MTDHISSDHAAVIAPGGDTLVAAPAAGTASRWEDFVDIFYAPSSVFARREHSGFGVPMLVVTVVGAAIFYATFNAMSPVFDAEFARKAVTMKGVTAEQLAAGRRVSETVLKVMAVVAPPVLMFLTGLFLWIVGKFVGARQTLNAAIMVAAFANVPRLVGGLIGGVQALFLDPSQLNSRYKLTISAARFLDPDTASPVLLAIAGRIDLFTIWATILLAIGLAVTGKIPRSKAAIAAGLLWVLGGLPELLGALRQ